MWDRRVSHLDLYLLIHTFGSLAMSLRLCLGRWQVNAYDAADTIAHTALIKDRSEEEVRELNVYTYLFTFYISG